ncbi:MAG: 2-oxoglutarate dehydrogenase E1 component [Parvicella sp.]|jgi:2-oxoglutarate dehydrogenase E1 component
MSEQSTNGRADPTFLNGANANYLDQLFLQYQQNPSSVDPHWQSVFADLPNIESSEQDLDIAPGSADWVKSAFHKQAQVTHLIDNYRRIGHLVANIDPLDAMKRANPSELALETYGLSDQDMDSVFDSGNLAEGGRKTLRDIIGHAEKIYCDSIGFEYRYISEITQRDWMRQNIETQPVRPARDDKARKLILNKLTAAEVMEQHLHRKYVGQKRFSLEGGDSLIPMLSDLIQQCGERGVKEMVIGMAHRGRLNVLVNILGKSPADLFAEFEGQYKLDDPNQEVGDVKYHKGFSSDIQTGGGHVHVALAFNPSHLEIVSPVVEGSVRARQERRGDILRKQVVPVAIHGDAAFAGQGVVMETLNMSLTRGYGTGGTIHIIVNNQIGFTTNALDARSTLYCTEVAKMVQAPILHVNGDDPDAVVAAIELALEYRCEFKHDVVIDLICYRRHGHNEADEPALTQPMMYKTIRGKDTPRALYATKLLAEGVIQAGEANKMIDVYRAQLDSGTISAGQIIIPNKKMVNWAKFSGKKWDEKIDTIVPAKTLVAINNKLYKSIPEAFGVHKRIETVYKERIEMAQGKVPIDWGCAEILAYGSLLKEGHSVRLSGQDCGRGTFSHRHAVVHNQKEADSFVPLREIPKDKNNFLVIDSLLSEEAVLAFEYGYSTTDPYTLVIWEAQFGDFANGAQVVIDQFIASGYSKWQRASALTLFLPHGQEGQGAEHSSARLERFLQLCAGTNMQVCVPTTPAQAFHMIRRQMLRTFRRPLVVMTPKSLLRHKLAVSSVEDLSEGEFQVVIPEVDRLTKKNCKRVILCSGKVYYDLLEERRNQKMKDVHIIRVEQLHPFPEEVLASLLKSYSHVKDILWCQEEPQNQGAWYQIRHHLNRSMPEGTRVKYSGRQSSPAPAVGYYGLFVEQQRKLVLDTLITNKS